MERFYQVDYDSNLVENFEKMKKKMNEMVEGMISEINRWLVG